MPQRQEGLTPNDRLGACRTGSSSVLLRSAAGTDTSLPAERQMLRPPVVIRLASVAPAIAIAFIDRLMENYPASPAQVPHGDDHTKRHDNDDHHQAG